MDKYTESERPLDNMIPDGFNDWMDNQDVEDICDYAKEWNKQEVKQAIEFEKQKIELNRGK